MRKEIATYGYLQIREAMAQAIERNELTREEIAKVEKIIMDGLDNLQGFIPASIVKVGA